MAASPSHRWRAALVMFIFAVLVACSRDGSGVYVTYRLELLPGEEVFVLRFEANAEFVSADGSGDSINKSPDEDCAIALYRFFAPPDLDLLPILPPADVPPTELPGGGELIEHFYLLASRGREYKVRHMIELAEGSDPSFPEWIVGVTCPGSQVETNISFVAYAVNQADNWREDVPQVEAPQFTREW